MVTDHVTMVTDNMYSCLSQSCVDKVCLKTHYLIRDCEELGKDGLIGQERIQSEPWEIWQTNKDMGNNVTTSAYSCNEA